MTAVLLPERVIRTLVEDDMRDRIEDAAGRGNVLPQFLPPVAHLFATFEEYFGTWLDYWAAVRARDTIAGDVTYWLAYDDGSDRFQSVLEAAAARAADLLDELIHGPRQVMR